MVSLRSQDASLSCASGERLSYTGRILTTEVRPDPMLIGVFELFKIGIGSSSSQRIGPMIAADQFLTEIEAAGVFGELAEDVTELFGLPALGTWPRDRQRRVARVRRRSAGQNQCRQRARDRRRN